MTQYLKEILNRLSILANQSTTEIHKDWVQVILNQFRQHLETQGTEKKYSILMFYCNWNLHKHLDRGIVQQMLSDISNVITDEKAGHPTDRISEIISLSKLRNEIIEVLKKDGGIKSELFEIYKNWIAFTELMFPFILNKPLINKNKPATNHWVKSLTLFNNNGKLYWKIKVLPENKEFEGPLMRTDPESNHSKA